MAQAILSAKASRKYRVVGYAFLAAAGVALVVANDFYVFQKWIWTTMAVFLVLGGSLCALGQWKRIWPPEYMGLPLVWTAMGVFTILQAVSMQGTTGIAFALGLGNLSLLASFATLLFSRWLDVAAVYRAAKEYAHAKR